MRHRSGQIVAMVATIVTMLAVSTITADAAVTTRFATLYAGPGPSYAATTVLPLGVAVAVHGCDAQWCEVSYRGQTGYVTAASIGAPPDPIHDALNRLGYNLHSGLYALGVLHRY